MLDTNKMGKLALLLITLNLLTALAVPSLFNDEEIILAPLLSSADAEVIPDQYIVVFKNDVTADRISYHHGCVGDMLSEERKKVKRGFMAELISGIEHTYNSDMFKGYSGRFSEYILNKIRQSDEVCINWLILILIYSIDDLNYKYKNVKTIKPFYYTHLAHYYFSHLFPCHPHNLHSGCLCRERF